MNRTKLTVANAADRDAVIVILARNGYTVRQGRVKEKNAYIYYVEYWRE
jgi:hypothetical protein